MTDAERQKWLSELNVGDKVAVNDSRIEKIRHITENGHYYVSSYTFNCLGEMVGQRNHKIYPVTQNLIRQLKQEDLFLKVREAVSNLRSTDLSYEKLKNIAVILKVK
jgi:3-dehydroquinate synthase class II